MCKSGILAGVALGLALTGGSVLAQSQGNLENPANGSFQSGLAVFSGWHCDANSIEIEIVDVGVIEAAYGTSRGDTADICGDIDNGFGVSWLMALLGPGEHTAIAKADGVEFSRRTFTVTDFTDGEFLRDKSAEVVVPNFPEVGKTVTLVWQQANQNFVVKAVSGGAVGGQQAVFDNGSVDSLWNAGIQAFDEQISYNSCGGNGEDCPSIAWDFVNDSERGSVLEVTNAGPGLAGLFFSADPYTDMSAFSGGTISFDIKVMDEGTNTSGFYMKVDCVYPCTSNDQAIGVVGLSGWETVTVDVDQLVGAGLDLSTVNTGLVLFPAGGQQTGVVYRLDNVYWSAP